MKHFIVAAVFSSLSVPLFADTLSLTAPQAGGSLQGAHVDLSAYWLADGAAYDLHVFYLEDTPDAEPNRLRMRLEDGDRVSFGLPGHRDVLYHFAADAQGVHISTQALEQAFARY